MAISANLARLLQRLPMFHGCSILEIGEAEWYGDVDPAEFGIVPRGTWHDVAKQFYSQLWKPEKTVAVDAGGTLDACRFDLNDPLPLDGQFDLVINHGTAEHIFNVAQVFHSMHDACAVGGLLVHDSPFTGWIDHGFYCLHPTLFFDLARANCYEVTAMAIHEIRSQTIIEVKGREHIAKLTADGAIPNNSMLFVALRKLFDMAFVVPCQGYYARQISKASADAWSALR